MATKSFNAAIILTALVFAVVLISSTTLPTGSFFIGGPQATSVNFGANLVVSGLKIYPIAHENPYVVEVPAGSNSKGPPRPPFIGYCATTTNIGSRPAVASNNNINTEIKETLPDGTVQSYGTYIHLGKLDPQQSAVSNDCNFISLYSSIALGADVAGWHTLIACADPGNTVKETNEKDNCRALTFLVKVV